jgi:hypothetical protein
MRSVPIALALAAALLVIALGLTLHGAPIAVAGSNGIPDAGEVARTRKATSACQAGESLPGATTAVRLTLAGEIGPAIAVTIRSGGHTIAHGSRGDGWTGASVTVPISHVAHTTPGTEICFALGHPLGDIEIFGEHTSGANALMGPRGEPLPGRMGVEYLRPGRASWLSLAPSIARRMGFGHAWGGAWIAFALLAAMASVAGLLAWIVRGDLRVEEPR